MLNLYIATGEGWKHAKKERNTEKGDIDENLL